MDSHKFFHPLKDIGHSHHHCKHVKCATKQNKEEELTITDVEIVSIPQDELKHRSTDYEHICNHVKYTNYSTHLGNHHHNKYTLGKRRQKFIKNRAFDHNYHHNNHFKIKIQDQVNPTFVSMKSLKESKNEPNNILETEKNYKKGFCALL